MAINLRKEKRKCLAKKEEQECKREERNNIHVMGTKRGRGIDILTDRQKDIEKKRLWP
jgi:hypothetical protein